MIKIKNKAGNETKVFAKTFENEAYEQIKKLIEHEAYMHSKIRIMPDAHAGKGCTIGTTMTIRDKITPNLVGVDIGCGMLTIGLKNKSLNFGELDNLIKSEIPYGFAVHRRPRKTFDFSVLRCAEYVNLERAILSIGSLGGGNHFIEVGKAEKTGQLYLIIHSGSRRLGLEVCEYYQEKAVRNASENDKGLGKIIKELKAKGKHKNIEKEIKKYKRNIPDKDLAYLSGKDFDDYMNDMSIVQKYASLNRESMAEIIIREIGLKEVSRMETIHNYIDFRRMILRKGAVSAEDGEELLIPLNMRDGSLLCIGKGNADWNYSAPHGAGRLMSRSKAKQTLSMRDFANSMKNIYTTSVAAETLDEAPQAYKHIDEIKECVLDSVSITDVLKPLYNFKAH